MMDIEGGSISKALILLVSMLGIAPMAAQSPTGHVQRVNEQQWIGSDDYPPSAARLGQEGKIVVRLAIEPAGNPISCVTKSSSGFSVLDAGTCDLLMRRAKYRPFDPRHGTTFDDVEISWKLMSASPVLAKAPARRIEAVGQDGWIDLNWVRSNLRGKSTGSMQALIAADHSGKSIQCTVAASSGNNSLDKRICQRLTKVSRFRLPPNTPQDSGLVTLNWHANLSGYSLMFAPR
jgi:TonB family protein